MDRAIPWSWCYTRNSQTNEGIFMILPPQYLALNDFPWVGHPATYTGIRKKLSSSVFYWVIQKKFLECMLQRMDHGIGQTCQVSRIIGGYLPIGKTAFASMYTAFRLDYSQTKTQCVKFVGGW